VQVDPSQVVALQQNFGRGRAAHVAVQLPPSQKTPSLQEFRALVHPTEASPALTKTPSLQEVPPSHETVTTLARAVTVLHVSLSRHRIEHEAPASHTTGLSHAPFPPPSPMPQVIAQLTGLAQATGSDGPPLQASLPVQRRSQLPASQTTPFKHVEAPLHSTAQLAPEHATSSLHVSCARQRMLHAPAALQSTSFPHAPVSRQSTSQGTAAGHCTAPEHAPFAQVKTQVPPSHEPPASRGQTARHAAAAAAAASSASSG
jgi:hypothetical protein